MKVQSLLTALVSSIILFSVCPAEEGLIIESKSEYSVMGMGGVKSQSVEYIAGDKFREEKLSQPYGLLQMSDDVNAENGVAINDYKNLTGWDIDLATNTYVTTDLSPVLETSQKPVDTGFVSFNIPPDPRFDNYECTTTMDSLNVVDTINGFPCRRISLRTSCKGSDLDSMLVTTNIWICTSFPGQDIYNNYQSNQRHILGIDDDADTTSLDLEEGNSLSKLLNFHMKVLARRSMAYNCLVVKHNMSMQTVVRRPSDSVLAAVGMDSDSSEFTKSAFAMYQNMFGSDSDEILMDVMSMSGEVVGMKSQDVADSLFVLPEGCALKNEAAAE